MASLFPARSGRRVRERASGLLFAFGVDDLSLQLASGQPLNFSRASGRTVVDSAGRIATLAHSQAPWSSVYNTAEGVWEPTFDLQKDSGNYCGFSEDFGSWTAIGTPTRVAAAARIGDVVLDLIGDDAAGTLEGWSRTVAPSGGNGPKGISIFLRAGTSTSTVVRYRDTTAPANRLLQTITWAGGVPTVTPSVGSHLGTIQLADGGYRFLFSCTAITSANTNVLEVYPATTSALAVTNVGTVYAGGVQVEADHHCHAYVKTPGAGTVFTQPDVAWIDLDWTPQDFTVYARVARQPWMGSALTIDYFNTIAAVRSGSGGIFSLRCDTVNRTFVSTLSDGTTPRTQSIAIPSAAMIDVCVQYSAVRTGGTTKLDVGGGFTAASAATGPITAWGVQELAIACAGGGLNQLDGGLRKLLGASGLRTLAEMRGLNV